MYVCYYLVITYVSCNDILMFWISLNKDLFIHEENFTKYCYGQIYPNIFFTDISHFPNSNYKINYKNSIAIHNSSELAHF